MIVLIEASPDVLTKRKQQVITGQWPLDWSKYNKTLKFKWSVPIRRRPRRQPFSDGPVGKPPTGGVCTIVSKP